MAKRSPALVYTCGRTLAADFPVDPGNTHYLLFDGDFAGYENAVILLNTDRAFGNTLNLVVRTVKGTSKKFKPMAQALIVRVSQGATKGGYP